MPNAALRQGLGFAVLCCFSLFFAARCRPSF
jgi:hypothetical protein